MTNLTPKAMALIDKVMEAWVAHKMLGITAEAKIRARIEAEMAELMRRSALQTSEAIRAAIEGGATQTALRQVTTKDQRTFTRYRTFDGLGPLP